LFILKGIILKTSPVSLSTSNSVGSSSSGSSICSSAALDLGFHLAAAPIAKVIAEEEPTRAYEILKGHEPYIPSIGNSFTDAYYKLLGSLEENKR